MIAKVEQLVALGVPGHVKVKIGAGGRLRRVFTALSEAPPDDDHPRCPQDGTRLERVLGGDGDTRHRCSTCGTRWPLQVVQRDSARRHSSRPATRPEDPGRDGGKY